MLAHKPKSYLLFKIRRADFLTKMVADCRNSIKWVEMTTHYVLFPQLENFNYFGNIISHCSQRSLRRTWSQIVPQSLSHLCTCLCVASYFWSQFTEQLSRMKLGIKKIYIYASFRDSAGSRFKFKGISNQILTAKLHHLLFDFLMFHVNLETYWVEKTVKKKFHQIMFREQEG